MYPNTIYFGPNVPFLGATLRPMYILYEYMDPYGNSKIGLNPKP